MITIGEDVNLNPNIQLLKPQVYENITVFPLKSDRSYIDIISLKKGLELGLVKVKECEQSQVNTLIVENNDMTTYEKYKVFHLITFLILLIKCSIFLVK